MNNKQGNSKTVAMLLVALAVLAIGFGFYYIAKIQKADKEDSVLNLTN